MIKSIFDEDESADSARSTEEKTRSRASVLGIYGEENEIGSGSEKRTSGPFDTAGIELPFPVAGDTTTPDRTEGPASAADSETQISADPETPETEIRPPTFGPPPPLADYTPPTPGETIRMSGLAWSAGIMLFGSIAFLTVIGWFADLLMGSSPWGVVGGVILGSVIGFVQLFRINAEILRITNRKRPSETTGIIPSAAETVRPAPTEEAPVSVGGAGDDNSPRPD